MTTPMVHSRSMLAKVIAESPSPFIITIFYSNVIKIFLLSINYFIKLKELINGCLFCLTKREISSEYKNF